MEVVAAAAAAAANSESYFHSGASLFTGRAPVAGVMYPLAVMSLPSPRLGS